MSFNLLETVQNLFPKDFINKTASILDENPKYVADGVSGIIPSVLTGLMQKGTTTDGLALIAKHSSDAKEVKFHDSLSKIITGKNYSKYEKLFDSAEELFGEKLSDITHKVSINSGLRETSANWLIRLVTPTALGVLGEQMKKNKLNITDAAQLIAKEKDSIINAVPEEYNLTTLFGFNSLQDIGNKFSNSVSFTEPEAIKLPTINPVEEVKLPEPIHQIEEVKIPEVVPHVEEIIPAIQEEIKKEEHIVEQPIIPEIKAPVEVEPKDSDNFKTIVVNSNNINTENQAKPVKVNNTAALKWQILSWTLIVLFFILLIILFNILPPMFRI